MTQDPCWPTRFSHPQLPVHYCADPTLAEQPLFDRARDGEAVAQLWQAPQGFVVPGSYRKFAQLSAVSELFSRQGWPVWLRRSGGGLVPKGPGIINLSLASLSIAGRSRRTHLSFPLRPVTANAGELRRSQPLSGGQRFILRRSL